MAEDATIDLLTQLPDIREMLKGDVKAAYDGDPAAKSYEEIVISYPCIIAIATYRIAHELYLKDVPLIPRIMTEYAHHENGYRYSPRRDDRQKLLYRPRHRRGDRRDEHHRRQCENLSGSDAGST